MSKNYIFFIFKNKLSLITRRFYKKKFKKFKKHPAFLNLKLLAAPWIYNYFNFLYILRFQFQRKMYNLINICDYL